MRNTLAKFPSWKDALLWTVILKADVAESNQGNYKNNKIKFVMKFIHIPEKQYSSCTISTTAHKNILCSWQNHNNTKNEHI